MAALLLGLGLAPAAAAAEIGAVAVSHEQGRYQIRLEARLAAPADAVYAVFTDFSRLGELNPSVREVDWQPQLDPPELTTRLRLCAGLFCRSLRQIQQMTLSPGEAGGQIVARVDGSRSDLRSGEARWAFSACGEQHTCLRFEAELEPGFWIPPLLGPWIVQRQLHEEALTTSRGLERLAAEAARR
ncbi:MAG TPA: SRPBCC family protein [Nevskiaceae bacterium]|nr:SRPBCC family protein [Nevskiaceae bacterium]